MAHYDASWSRVIRNGQTGEQAVQPSAGASPGAAAPGRRPMSGDPSARAADGDARCDWGGASRWWFEALDARRVAARGASWVARVVGVHEMRPHLWIQLEPADGRGGLVLHVTLETRLDEALAAIAASGLEQTGPVVVDAAAASAG